MKKSLLVLALISSVSAGIYYMGKSTVIKRLKENGQVEETIDNNGKIQNVLTSKGQQSAIEKVPVTQETGMFDYNNPALHSSKNYWLENTSGIFYLPNYKNGKETNTYTEIVVNNGIVSPTIAETVKSGIKSLIPFLK